MRWAYLGGLMVILATLVSDIWLPINYRVIANTALVAIAALTTAFVLLYGLRSNWRRNRIGRTLFAKSVVLPFVLWQSVLSVWWDMDYPFRQQIRFTIFVLGAIAYATMLVSLWREQQRDRRGESAEQFPPV